MPIQIGLNVLKSDFKGLIRITWGYLLKKYINTCPYLETMIHGI